MTTIEPQFEIGDPVFIRDEQDRVLGKYPYTIGRRFRYGGEACWSWNYVLHGIEGRPITTVFEDQIVKREASS